MENLSEKLQKQEKRYKTADARLPYTRKLPKDFFRQNSHPKLKVYPSFSNIHLQKQNFHFPCMPNTKNQQASMKAENGF